MHLRDDVSVLRVHHLTRMNQSLVKCRLTRLVIIVHQVVIALGIQVHGGTSHTHTLSSNIVPGAPKMALILSLIILIPGEEET